MNVPIQIKEQLDLDIDKYEKIIIKKNMEKIQVTNMSDHKNEPILSIQNWANALHPYLLDNNETHTESQRYNTSPTKDN